MQTLSDKINQSGARPGRAKLEQFKEALRLQEAPQIGTTDGQGDCAMARVKLFNPVGSWTWYLTEWDGGQMAFGLVDGFEKELGYIDLEELAFTPGPLGIGIEIDVYWEPKALKDIR